jgi:hypothetical protein
MKVAAINHYGSLHIRQPSYLSVRSCNGFDHVLIRRVIGYFWTTHATGSGAGAK